MQLKTPKAIIHGHQNLNEELKEVLAIGGKISEKARFLMNTMQPHFQKEEDYALPPLGLLLSLSEGNWEIDAEEAVLMADTLQLRLAEMTDDHINISKDLDELKAIAEEEGNIIAQRFVRNLIQHIELEDQVLYPATLLIGNYLKKLGKP